MSYIYTVSLDIYNTKAGIGKVIKTGSKKIFYSPSGNKFGHSWVSDPEIVNFGQAQGDQGITLRHTHSMPHKKSLRLTPRSLKRSISGWKLLYIGVILLQRTHLRIPFAPCSNTLCRSYSRSSCSYIGHLVPYGSFSDIRTVFGALPATRRVYQ